MIEIELPCCGTATYLDELADIVGCETCGVVLELARSHLPAAACVAELRAPAHARSRALAGVLAQRLGLDSASATGRYMGG